MQYVLVIFVGTKLNVHDDSLPFTDPRISAQEPA